MLLKPLSYQNNRTETIEDLKYNKMADDQRNRKWKWQFDAKSKIYVFESEKHGDSVLSNKT